MFNNKTLLITGGTGSFGNTLLRRFLHTDIKEIRVFSRDEKKQDEMRNVLQNPKLKFYLGSAGDLEDVKMMLCATAFKQVTPCEFFSI